MFKKVLCTGLIVLSLMQSGVYVNAVSQTPVKTMANTTMNMFNSEYWINKIPDKDRVLMSLEDIELYNKEMNETQQAVSYDLAAFPKTFSKEKLTAHVDIKFPTDPCFVSGKELGQEYWDNLRAQINIDGIKEENEIKYGFTVKRTNLKIFPTADIVSDEAIDLAFDQFQNTAVLAYEPVLILHQSLDAKWMYIYMHNCSGWVSASDVAISKDKDSWLNEQKLEEGKFLVVTGNKIQLDCNFESPDVSEIQFTMGTILPLASEEEIPALIDRRGTFDNYIVKLPVRGENGELAYKLAMVPVSKDVSLGYLKFTRGNVLKQVFKMQGDRYGWGGMMGVRDCSSLVLEIYRCFGFRMPRNTEAQVECPGKTLNVEGYSVKGREAMLDSLQPGAALYFPGHTMIYLGKDQGRYYVMSSLGSFAEFPEAPDKPVLQRTYSVALNELNIKRRNGKTWLESLTAGKQFEKTTFKDLVGFDKKKEIESLADAFIFTGKTYDMFNPSGKITRAEVSKILSRGFKLEEDKEFAVKTFKDVSKSWFFGYTGALAKEGYLSVPKNKLFEPAKLIDLAYMKSIAGNALKKNGLDTSTAQGTKVLEEILTIYPDGSNKKINKISLTRYETAVITDNLLKTVADLKKVNSEDNK